MKLMFASDIHGSLPATEQVLSHFERSGAKWLILLGDVLNHGPRNALPAGYNPGAVAERFNSIPITAPWQQILMAEQRLFVTHGHLYNPDKLPPLAENDVLVFGHTHLPLAEKQDTVYLFNPGSVSIPKGGFEPSYGMLNDGVLSVHALNNDGVIAQVEITP